jgi:hypothetical protein
VRFTISVHRARSDRHTFVECSELDPTYNPRRNRDRNVDPASAKTPTQKLRPQSVNHVLGCGDSGEAID